MVIKIFTKRLPGGQPLKTGLEWIDSMIEADKILTKRDGNTVKVFLENDDSASFEKVDLKTHGYQVYNNAGVVIEKFVTAIEKEAVS